VVEFVEGRMVKPFISDDFLNERASQQQGERESF